MSIKSNNSNNDINLVPLNLALFLFSFSKKIISCHALTTLF